jgi:hypothetical protein
VLVITILVAVKLTSPTKKSTNVATSPAASTLANDVTTVSPTSLDTVGKGAVDTMPKANTGRPVLSGTTDGKPLVFYMGGNVCSTATATAYGPTGGQG